MVQLHEITHTATLKAIAKKGITNDQLMRFETLVDFRKWLRGLNNGNYIKKTKCLHIYIKEKYHSDPVFRQKMIDNSKRNYQKKKEAARVAKEPNETKETKEEVLQVNDENPSDE